MPSRSPRAGGGAGVYLTLGVKIAPCLQGCIV